MNDDTPPQSVGRTLRRDERAVSFTVGYVLTIAISVVLIAGVLLTVGQVVRDEREQTIRGEAAVVGDQTAAAVMEVDRLVQRGGADDSNVTIALRLPDRLASQPYTVSLRGSASEAMIVVRTQSPSVSVVTPLANTTNIGNETVTGDDLRVVYRNTTGKLTLEGGDG